MNFLRPLLLCALFYCAINTLSASRNDYSDSSDYYSDSEDIFPSRLIKTSSYRIDSFEDVKALFEEEEITWGPGLAAFFDNDETISHSIFDPGNSDDLFFYLCCPDLSRTYEKAFEAAAAFLQKEDPSKDCQHYKDEIKTASRWMIMGDGSSCHSYQLIEGEALGGVIQSARQKGSYLKVCSGLGLTIKKYILFETYKDSLGFKVPNTESYTREGADYLWSNQMKKEARITKELYESQLPEGSIHTIILFDNSPQSCDGFLEDMKNSILGSIKCLAEEIHIIAVQYDFFATQLTPELLVDEYKRYLDLRDYLRS